MAFKEIEDIKDYVRQLGASGAEAHMYVKTAKIKAYQGTVGQSISTTMKDGLQETKNTVTLDPKTNQPGWVVTNPDGELYIIPDSEFNKNYVADPSADGTYMKKGGKPCWFVQIQEDISFTAPWGEKMNIAAGGYLNITNPNDIYGVQFEAFNQTYKMCDEKGNVIDPNTLNQDGM